MNVRNWKSSSNLKQNILDTLSLWGSIGLLWWSFLSMIKEYFPEFLRVTVEVRQIVENGSEVTTKFVNVTYKADYLWIVLFLFVLWLGYDLPKKHLKKWALPCQFAGVLVPVIYIVFNFKKVVDGVIGMSTLYLPYFNAYYQMNFYMGEAKDNANIVVAFTAISMLLWWIVWMLAYAWKKKILLVLFPVVALALELAVGESPFGLGLFLIFFAAMLLNTLGGSSILKKGLVLAAVGLSIMLSGALFEDDMEELATEEKKQEIISWQNNFSWESVNIIRFLQLDLHFNWEPLNNSTPQYTGKTVLEIESDIKPVSTLYLKGFYGTNYTSGNWTYDDSAFREACKEAGKSAEEVAKYMFQMPFERWKAYEMNLSSDRGIAYKISYVGATGDVAYVPYVSDYDSLDEAYGLMGDYLFKKSVWDKELQVMSKDRGNVPAAWWGIHQAIEKGFGNYEDDYLSAFRTPTIDVTDQLEELEFINSLSSAYLQVPVNKEYISEAGKTLLQMVGELRKVDANRGISYDYNSNYYRMRYAEAVTVYLESQMSYSLKLDRLPAGADPIEYALTVSHEGYCMHFASAATMLLREGGVPARYVSGYAVDTSAFKKNEETGRYEAEVGDFMAHAWVEIYLDHIGWVPIEVTPGSSLENLPTEADKNRWESEAEAHRQELENQEKPSEDTESEDTQTESEESQAPSEEESQTPSEETQSSQMPSEAPAQNSESESSSGDGTGVGTGNGMNSKIWKELGILAAILLVCVLIVQSVKYAISRYHRILQQEMDKNMTRKAVKRMNRRVYRIIVLRSPRLWFVRKLSDIDYEVALKEQYTEKTARDWEVFMEIVKKNHYSHEPISTKEMQYCYDCYKTVKLFCFTHKEKGVRR